MGMIVSCDEDDGPLTDEVDEYWPPVRVAPEIERFLAQFTKRADLAGKKQSKFYVSTGARRVLCVTVEKAQEMEERDAKGRDRKPVPFNTR